MERDEREPFSVQDRLQMRTVKNGCASLRRTLAVIVVVVVEVFSTKGLLEGDPYNR